MTVGMDRANLRAAETVGEGAHSAAQVQHLPSGDSAPSREYDRKRAFTYRIAAIALAALLVWFILLVLMLP